MISKNVTGDLCLRLKLALEIRVDVSQGSGRPKKNQVDGIGEDIKGCEVNEEIVIDIWRAKIRAADLTCIG